MTNQSEEERIRAAEEQNRRVQEEARRSIQEDEERRLAQARDAIGQPLSTRPTTFQEAARATDELDQPPSEFNKREIEEAPTLEQPEAKNVTDATLSPDVRAENVATNEATVASPSVPSEPFQEAPQPAPEPAPAPAPAPTGTQPAPAPQP